MKINLRKNKLIFINTILLLISFIVFFVFFFTLNYDAGGDGKFSFFTTFLDEMVYGELEDFASNIFVLYIPLILIIASSGFGSFIFMTLIDIQHIKYFILTLGQIVYLVTVIWIYLIDLSFGKISYITPYLSSAMLLPIIAFSVYNLVCIVIFYVKDKKKPVDIEKESAS
ncbi:MAG: hypothetical protein E7348_03105 [Clostridiales bacterium]|nr:hypothetical protein [Clostridiales bacterium]